MPVELAEGKRGDYNKDTPISWEARVQEGSEASGRTETRKWEAVKNPAGQDPLSSPCAALHLGLILRSL